MTLLYYLFYLGLWNPNEFTISEVFQATMLILELAILEQRAQILGGICMFDLGGLTMQQVWYMSPTIAKHIFDIMVVRNFFNEALLNNFIYNSRL